MAVVCNRTDIGAVDGVPEFKVEWEGSPIPLPVLYTRKSRIVAYAEICAPDDLVNQVWNDIVQCAAGAAATSVAAIIASPVAALPAFKAAFIACMGTKIGARADDINVALSTQQESDPVWHRV